MNYELAKKLKDAGFPQKETNGHDFSRDLNPQRFLLRENADSREGEYDSLNDRTMWVCFFKESYVEEMKEFVVYIPTLSEIIEACGDDFDSLRRNRVHNEYGDCWVAYSRRMKAVEFIPINAMGMLGHNGESPEEAVANLWLSLNRG